MQTVSCTCTCMHSHVGLLFRLEHVDVAQHSRASCPFLYTEIYFLRDKKPPQWWIHLMHVMSYIPWMCNVSVSGSTGAAPGRTHVSLCRSASLSLDTRSFCESLLFSPSTVSSAGRDSSKRVPVVDWIDKCMQCSLCCCRSSEHRDRDPWPVQPRASACCSIRARAKTKNARVTDPPEYSSRVIF